MKHPGENSRSQLIRADVRMNSATIFIFLHSADDDWPFIIENESDFTILFCQQVSIYHEHLSPEVVLP